MIETLPYFYFKGVQSLENRLFITEKNTYAGAARDVEFIQIPGRNGELLIDNKRFNNVVIEYGVAVLEGSKNIAEIAHDVKGWLASDVGYYELKDSYDPNYYRFAAYVDQFNLDQELPALGKAKIVFKCKPLKYLISGKNTITMISPGTITNPEQFPSSPYIKIIGSGNITLSINNVNYIFRGVDGYIEIDSETMNAYKGTSSQNSKMFTPMFPEFKKGENGISWTGNVSSVEIKPRWCCL